MREKFKELLSLGLLLLFSCLHHGYANGVDPRIESMQNALDTASGIERIKLLGNLGVAFVFTDYEKASQYYDEMASLVESIDTLSRANKLDYLIRIQQAKNWGSYELGNFVYAFPGSIVQDSLANLILQEKELTLKAYTYFADASNLRGAMFTIQKQYNNADTEFRRVYDYSVKSRDSVRIGWSLLSLGHNAIEADKPAEALTYYYKVDSIYKAINAPPQSLSLTSFAIGRAYIDLEKWKEAEAILKKTIALGEDAMDRSHGGVKMEYAKVLLNLNQLELAYKYATESIAIHEKTDKEHHDLSHGYRILADIEEARNNIEAANQHRKKSAGFTAKGIEKAYSEELIAIQAEYINGLNPKQASTFKWWFLLIPILLFAGILIWYLKKPKVIEHEPLEIAWKNEQEVPQITDPFLERFVKKVQDNLENYSLSVEGIAEEFNLSRVQLFKKIKAATGSSLSQLIRKIRLETAERLLIENNTTVSEVAYKVGFTNPNSFSRSFKDHFGKTPSDYLIKTG